MKGHTILAILLGVVVLVYSFKKLKEGFAPYFLGYNVGFPYFQHPVVPPMYSDEPDVVLTSGTDTLTPLPYWVAYGAPGYWPYALSPYWYYDVPWYGPINSSWIGPSPWVGGRDRYRPGHGPGYRGVATGGGGGGGHSSGGGSGGGHGGGGGGGHH
jgi:uncharacterized membrane protein YgcG